MSVYHIWGGFTREVGGWWLVSGAILEGDTLGCKMAPVILMLK